MERNASNARKKPRYIRRFIGDMGRVGRRICPSSLSQNLSITHKSLASGRGRPINQGLQGFKFPFF